MIIHRIVSHVHPAAYDHTHLVDHPEDVTAVSVDLDDHIGHLPPATINCTRCAGDGVISDSPGTEVCPSCAGIGALALDGLPLTCTRCHQPLATHDANVCLANDEPPS